MRSIKLMPLIGINHDMVSIIQPPIMVNGCKMCSKYWHINIIKTGMSSNEQTSECHQQNDFHEYTMFEMFFRM